MSSALLRLARLKQPRLCVSVVQLARAALGPSQYQIEIETAVVKQNNNRRSLTPYMWYVDPPKMGSHSWTRGQFLSQVRSPGGSSVAPEGGHGKLTAAKESQATAHNLRTDQPFFAGSVDPSLPGPRTVWNLSCHHHNLVYNTEYWFCC